MLSVTTNTLLRKISYFLVLIASISMAEEEQILASKQDHTTVASFDSLVADQNFKDINNKFKENLIQQWSTLAPELKAKAQSKFSKELDRYKFSTILGLRDNKISILSNDVGEIPLSFADLNLSVNMYYQLTVQPAFRGNKQLRKDMYIVSFKGSNIITAGFEMRISFYREYDSKVDAIFNDLPYWIDDFPKTAQDISKKIKNHEGIRAEILGNFGIEKGILDKVGGKKVGLNVGYNYSGLFLMDFYKHTDTDVRLRFLGSFSKGSITANADASLGKSLFSWAPRWLKDLTQVGLFARAQKSFNLFNDFPIDTNLFDYYFNFEPFQQSPTDKQETIQAFNQILSNLRNGNFLKIFNPTNSENEFFEKLNENSQLAANIVKNDLLLNPNQRRVHQLFQGKMLANIFSFDLGPKISHLFKASKAVGSSKIFISQVNAENSYDHYILLNHFNRDYTSTLFGRSESEFISDFDALFTADQNKNTLALNHIISKIQYRDKELNDSEYKQFYHTVFQSIPSGISSKQNLINLIPQKNQTNIFCSFKYGLSNDAIKSVAQIPKSTLYYKIYEFVENHPEKNYMDLPRSDNDSPVYLDYYNFLHEITNDLSTFVNEDNTPKQRFEAIDRLLAHKLFNRYLISQFIPSLISPEEQENRLYLQLTTSSSQQKQQTIFAGKNRISPIYDSIVFLRSILNDRNFEFSLDSINQENSIDINPRSLFSSFKFN
ncbi:MAG: hypothetical protein L6Q37_06610 [Bdellovibrionaceae bacterium]|nr:hypothetical protein [Pseudobdellovibrionaceae bacterium]